MQVSGKKISFLLAATLALTLLFSSAALAFNCSGKLNSCTGVYAGSGSQICTKFRRAVMKHREKLCHLYFQYYRNIGSNTCKSGTAATYSSCGDAVN